MTDVLKEWLAYILRVKGVSETYKQPTKCSSTLKLEKVSSSETSVNFYQPAGCYILTVTALRTSNPTPMTCSC
jgi:hypothetical protein